MDETLKALVEAAERGENVPHVQIALGSGLVSGLPIPHAEYVELQQQSIRVDILKSQGRIKLREQKAAKEAAENLSVELATFAHTAPDRSALVLKDVTLSLWDRRSGASPRHANPGRTDRALVGWRL